MAMSVFMIILLVPLVVGVVVMLRSSMGRRVLAGVGLAVLVLVGGVFFSTPRRFEVAAERGGGRLDAVVVERGPGYQVARVSSEAGPTGAVWSAGLEAQFAAEPYSSVESAARALGRQLAQEVRQVAGQDQGQIQVDLKKGPVPMPIVLEDIERELGQPKDLGKGTPPWKGQSWGEAHAALAEEARSHIPSNAIIQLEKAGSLEEGTTREEGGDIEGTLSFEVSGYEPWQTLKELRGTLRLVLRGPGGEVSRSAEFVEKQWVTDFAGLVNQQKGRLWVVGRSQETAMDAGEAYQQAMQDAVGQVCRMLEKRGGSGTVADIGPWDIEDSGVIADKFVQSLQTTTGKVYREALLLDVSPNKMARLRQKVLGQVAKQRWTWAGMAVSLAGMLGVIVAVYLFLNAATKGYYTWALRIGVVVLALGLGGVVWFIVVHGYWLNVK